MSSGLHSTFRYSGYSLGFRYFPMNPAFAFPKEESRVAHAHAVTKRDPSKLLLYSDIGDSFICSRSLLRVTSKRVLASDSSKKKWNHEEGEARELRR